MSFGDCNFSVSSGCVTCFVLLYTLPEVLRHALTQLYAVNCEVMMQQAQLLIGDMLPKSCISNGERKYVPRQ